MRIVKTYKGYHIRRYATRSQTLDERDETTHYTVRPVNLQTESTFMSPRLRTPGEAMRWIDERKPESE